MATSTDYFSLIFKICLDDGLPEDLKDYQVTKSLQQLESSDPPPAALVTPLSPSTSFTRPLISRNLPEGSPRKFVVSRQKNQKWLAAGF